MITACRICGHAITWHLPKGCLLCDDTEAFHDTGRNPDAIGVTPGGSRRLNEPAKGKETRMESLSDKLRRLREEPDARLLRDMREFDWGEPISVYTRAQAIEDGVLVDVTEAARRHGFIIPVAMTSHLAGTLQDGAAPIGGFEGRRDDVLRLAAKRLHAQLESSEPGDMGPHELDVQVGRAVHRIWVTATREGVTIMHPEDN